MDLQLFAASALTVQTLTNAGLAFTTAAANVDGNYITNDGYTFLYIVNGGASPITITFAAPVNCNQGFADAHTIIIPAGETWVSGYFEKSRFNSLTGTLDWTYSAVTSVTIAAIKVTQ